MSCNKLCEIWGKSNENSVIVKWQFSWIFSLIVATSSSVTMVDRPLRSSSWTLVQPFFKHNVPLPYSAIVHYFISVHLTKLPINFNWFVVFHQQKPNHRTHLATRGIFYCSTHFKNSLWTKQEHHKPHATTDGCLVSEGTLWNQNGGASTAHRLATPKRNLLSG